jgi:hypothetical protein
MHGVPLVYFRSLRPLAIDSFVAPGMVGTRETGVTYPVFFRGPAPGHDLFFQYRDGGSGNGTTLWNRYDLAQKKWARVTDQGLFNGEGVVNAYPSDPLLGPDGYFHIIWMWRETPVANTNHDLSHMKSKDLLNWETMSGTKLTLPVVRATAGVVVDPVQSGNGLINMSFNIGWDSQKRAVVGYHKYDAGSISQRWNTRWETNKWVIYQTSSWTTYKWPLDLTGSLVGNISADPVSIDGKGRLVQNYYHVNYGSRMWILNEATLKPLKDTLRDISPDVASISRVESTFPGMEVHLLKSGDYYLRWETLPQNQDQPRNPPLPAPGMLRVYKIGVQTGLAIAPAVGAARQAISSHYSGSALLFDVPAAATPAKAAIFTVTGRKAVDFGKVSNTHLAWKPLRRGCYVFVYTSKDLSSSIKVVVP